MSSERIMCLCQRLRRTAGRGYDQEWGKPVKPEEKH